MKTFLEKIKFLNQTTLESFNEQVEKDIVKKFTAAGINILDADFGFAWFKNPDSRKFELLYKSPSIPYDPRAPRKNGSSQRVMSSRKPLLITNLEKNKFIRNDAHPFVKSLAIIPISYKNKIHGSIFICFKKKREFNGEDKSLCTFIGNSAAQAITIHRFYGDLEDTIDRRTAQLKKTNNQLERDKAEDEAILSSIGEGLIATDNEGKIIMVNPTAEKMLGRSQKEIFGKTLYSAQPLVDKHGQSVAPEQRLTYLALSSGKRISSSDYSYITKSGKRLPLFITAAPVMQGDKIVGSIQVFRDIAKEKEIDQAKSELISLASHQLRTPLSGINWYVEALIKEEVGKLNRMQKKYLGEVHRANQKLVELVYDFLNVSRIELGTFNLKLSSVNIKEVSRNVIEELRPAITEKGLKIKEAYGKGLENVQIDRKVIRLVLQNLITNSVKYTPDEGKVKISMKIEGLRDSNKWLSLVVTDNGLGIPKKDQPKMFSKLFRSDNVKTLDAEGTGLGLYIVKSFIELCSGKIWFKSKEKKGTTFYVKLPLTQIKEEEMDKIS